MNNVVAAYHATIAPGWRSLRVVRTNSFPLEDMDPVELADQLATAGCDHPVIVRALRDPIDELETLWVLELFCGEEPGSLLGRRLA
jgi:hypothetical protein